MRVDVTISQAGLVATTWAAISFAATALSQATDTHAVRSSGTTGRRTVYPTATRNVVTIPSGAVGR